MSAPPENVVQELIAALGRLRRGDLHSSVSFADEGGEIGRLGREFNETIRELRGRNAGADPKAVSKLVHDIKNPLAGIAGVLEIIAQDLPQGSQAREVMPEVKAEIERIKQVLADFSGS